MVTVYTRDSEFYCTEDDNVSSVITKRMISSSEIIAKDLEKIVCKEYFHSILEYFGIDTLEYWDKYWSSKNEYSTDSTFDNVSTNQDLINWCIEHNKED